MKSEEHWIEDASGFRGHADAVFAPASEAELAALLKEAAAASIPVTISGAGTGVAGGRVPNGGWSVSMDRFKRLETGDGYAIAGAGVLLQEVQAAAGRSGQFYAPDPTENSASVGGSIATNASGSRSFCYGDTRRHVLALRVVLMDGTVLELERGTPVPFDFTPVPVRQTTKNTAGYFLRQNMDYLDLFIGSEGTLGVVTEARLRLLPAPADLLSGVVFLSSDADALAAVESWRGIPGLRMLEYMDSGSLEMLRPRHPGIPAQARAALLIEQQAADEAAVEEWISRLEEAGALLEESWFGTEAADRERFRVFRHALPEAVNETVRHRGVLKMGTDFAVPVAQNAAMMAFYRETLEREFPGAYVIFGHIGDAHVHANILPSGSSDAQRAQQTILLLARHAVELGGTVSAEHGVGKRKAALLNLMFTEAEFESMRTVKSRLDPGWLLGRGTILAPVPL